ncbi:MAG: erythromycin esterase family protein [Crocinitomicaceae bacterium]|nr:erythromycin esterase family protein [Crocinitomicaceae bacterium]
MKKIQILITLIFILNISLAIGQSFLRDSKEYIFPFKAIDDNVLLQHINEVSESARIIGLGEVSHYTKECYQLKHQIINTLINKGFDALILEVDFGQSLLWNDYVTNGIGNLDTLIAESGWFTYRTQEFKNLLLDIRNYNRSADKPFQIFGMEMTAVNNNLLWLSKYFEKYLSSEDELIKLLNQERTVVAFQSHNKSEILSYWELYYRLNETLVKNEKHLVAIGGQMNYEIAKRNTEIARQYSTYISQDEFLLKVEIRDQFSTRNVFWSMDMLGEDSKVVIWAHNGHVAKESVLFSYDILGYYLNKWLGEQYYSIGFTFNEGEFGAFSSNGFKKWTLPPVTSESLTKDFSTYKSPFLLFDIESNLTLEDISNYSPLKNDVPIRTDVSESFSEENTGLMDINLSITYDCLIYIDKTNYPTTIEWKQ